MPARFLGPEPLCPFQSDAWQAFSLLSQSPGSQKMVASPIWGYQREGGTILRALTQSWNPGPRDQVWACMSQPRTQRGPVLALLSPTCSGLTPNGQDLCSFA